MVELGQEPHAPCRRNFTIAPSISTSSTLPPSAIKYGRNSSKTCSTFRSLEMKIKLSFTRPGTFDIKNCYYF